MHYVRLKTHDDPSINLFHIKKNCLVKGCDKKYKAHGYCQMHYKRAKNGHSLTGELKTLNPKRYRLITDRNHPLAFKNGRVLLHRKVLYDFVNGSKLPCFWCSIPLDWHGVEHEKLCVDHLDHNRHNNDVTNLVPSCNSCNAGRMKGYKPRISQYVKVE